MARVEDAYERLKAQILDNQLPAGYQATESEVAIHLGMSRTPVREALLKLEFDGLIELVPRRGARVLPVSANDMSDIYEILSALEPAAVASLASKGLTDAEIARLESITQEMEAALGNGDLDSWAQADDRFHREILRLHGNRRLTAFVSALLDQAHRARMITLRLREKPVASTRDHREVLEHIINRSPAEARQAFSKHRERAATELLSLLRELRLPQL